MRIFGITLFLIFGSVETWVWCQALLHWWKGSSDEGKGSKANSISCSINSDTGNIKESRLCPPLWFYYKTSLTTSHPFQSTMLPLLVTFLKSNPESTFPTMVISSVLQ